MSLLGVVLNAHFFGWALVPGWVLVVLSVAHRTEQESAIEKGWDDMFLLDGVTIEEELLK